MFAGITFSRQSGKIVGVHQKIDRASRRNLNLLIKKSNDFPGIRNIIHFEGKNGPDGLTMKKSSKDIPWHFIDPLNPNDRSLLDMINDHIYNLSVALKNKDEIRASFEAAWLAHAVTDGLTPAHLQHSNDKVEEIFGDVVVGEKRQKKLAKGKNKFDSISKNWEYWGVGGVILSHLRYEFNIATIVASEKYEAIRPSDADLEFLRLKGFELTFLKSVKRVYNLKSYEKFCKHGTTLALAMEIRQIIMPEIINCVTLSWYFAYLLSKDRVDAA